MAKKCGDIVAGEGIVTFNPFNAPRARCIELLDWGITHKNGVPLVVTKPTWAAFVASNGAVTEPSTGTFQYTLPLVLTIQMIDAFPVGEADNFYSFFYVIQRSDCKGGPDRCDTILKQPKFCEGLIIPPTIAPQVVFLSLVSGTTYRVWSALIGGTFVEIKQIDAGGTPRNVCAVASLALDGEDRIYHLHNKTAGNPEISAMDYDGGNVADYGNPGSTGVSAGMLAITYPPEKTFPTDPPDFMYWWISRRGWGNRDTAPANWGTNNFGAKSMAAYDSGSADGHMIVFTDGSNPFDRRDYKTGAQFVSGAGVPKTIRTDRTRQRTFFIDTGSGELIEADSDTPTTELSRTTLQGSTTLTGLIGVDLAADLAYLFEDFDGDHHLMSYKLDGTERTILVNITADVTSGAIPHEDTGVMG